MGRDCCIYTRAAVCNKHNARYIRLRWTLYPAQAGSCQSDDSELGQRPQHHDRIAGVSGLPQIEEAELLGLEYPSRSMASPNNALTRHESQLLVWGMGL